jgi:hypothetical protein
MAVGDHLEFAAWQRSGLFRLGTGGRPAGRLVGVVPMKLTETKSSAPPLPRSATAQFLFVGPQDVATIAPRSIARMAPPPFTPDAETTKFVHVDFAETDFPWRYSPEADDETGAGRVRPWLTLLVGTTRELNLAGNLLQVRDDQVYRDHNLDDSYLWAHVQNPGGTSLGRLISPRALAAQSEYLAVLVPCFDEAGHFAWKVAGGQVTAKPAQGHPVLASWRFSTVDGGDFVTLCEALSVLNENTSLVGVAQVGYRGSATRLSLRGAITRINALPAPPDDPAADPPADPVGVLSAEQKALLQAARVELAPLHEGVSPDGHPEIGLHNFGQPWQADPLATTWGRQLADNPWTRGVAGLGVWLAIEEQEKLLQVAIEQAGALAIAARRVEALAFGLHADGRLWERRTPADPMERLWLLGPALGRMLAGKDGQAVGALLDQVAGGDSPLPTALFCSTARRVLRRNTPRTRYLTTAGPNGSIPISEILDRANRCPAPPERAPSGLPHLDQAPRPDPAELALIKKLIDFLRQFAGRKVDPNPQPNVPVAEKIADFIAELLGAPPVNRQTLRADLLAYFQANPGQDMTVSFLLVPLLSLLAQVLHIPGDVFRINDQDAAETLIDIFVREQTDTPETPPCRRRDLGKLATQVTAAIDPRGDNPLVVGRVQKTIDGIDIRGLGPPKLPLSFDFPAWTLLKTHARDWLLPGVDTLPKNSVIALTSNPTFVDEFLLGLNTQFKNELHWRKLGDATLSTPFRLFWGPVTYGQDLILRTPDIQPIDAWPPNTPVGDTSHQVIRAGDLVGNRNLMVVFRSDLFRRYPTTQVFLRLLPPGAPPPDATIEAALKRPPTFKGPDADVGPAFQGTLMEDVTFFMFDIDPADRTKYWLILEEPPVDIRFRHDEGTAATNRGAPLPKTNSAAFADKSLDLPTRVAIAWSDLPSRGN